MFLEGIQRVPQGCVSLLARGETLADLALLSPFIPKNHFSCRDLRANMTTRVFSHLAIFQSPASTSSSSLSLGQ